MAVTAMPTDSALAVKLWEVEGFVDIMKRTAFGHMFNRGTIMRAARLDNSQVGDEVTLNFTGILTQEGQTEGGTLTGNEEALDLQAFTMRQNVLRAAVLSPNDDTIEQVRTVVPFESRSRLQLPRWHASRLDASVFNQLAGVNTTTISVDTTVYSGNKRQIVQGLNTINAPTTNRIIRAGDHANDESITSSDTFTLDLIDAAIEQLGRTYPHVEALDDMSFDLYISYEQMTDLKRDSSGKIQWYQNYLSQMEGGVTGDENPIFSANQYRMQPVAKYANVYIYSSFRVATGQNSSTAAAITNVRRAVLCGRDAVGFASKFSGALEDLGAMEGNVPLKIYTQLKDYDYQKGVEARMIYGLKKLQFDSEDYGSTVIATYAAPHTS